MLKTKQHGGNIYHFAKTLKCKPSEIIDFSSNINTCSPRLNINIEPHVFSHYGDPSYTILHQAIKKRYQVKTKEIVLFNGASSAIFSLFSHLKPKLTYLYNPMYSEYSRASKLFSKTTKSINRFKNIYKKPKQNATVVFVNPATPDGKYYNLTKLFKLWKRQNCTIIVDESFLEFTQKPSLRKMINRYKKLYIIQSFTKFYACAGLRVGAIFTHQKNALSLIQPIWNISSLDATYVSLLLQDKKHTKTSLLNFKKQSKKLRKILKTSALFDKIYSSDANYILVRSNKAQKIYKHLLKQNILVRECSNFTGLDSRYLRFALKNNHDLHTLKKALYACT